MPAKTRNKPDVTIVGIGRLGTALALALNREGYPINALLSRRVRSAAKGALLLDTQPVVLAAKNLKKNHFSPVVIIATPDDQIGNVAKQFASLGRVKNRVALHTSGALSSAVLSELKQAGWFVGSLHPLISVSEPVSGATALRGAYWCIEGDTHATRTAKSIVKDLDGHSFSVKPEQKSLYHAAAVMASGNLVALFDVALEMLERCGLSKRDARRALLPLVTSTVSNLLDSQPTVAMTGTFARADEATVDRHLQALDINNLKIARGLYVLLGQRSVELALKQGADAKALSRISAKLKSE